LKNPVALKVLVWSRGRLVALQILVSSSFSLVEETLGLGQCVSFSFIDVGSGFIAFVVSLFFFDLRITKAEYEEQGVFHQSPLQGSTLVLRALLGRLLLFCLAFITCYSMAYFYMNP